MDYDDDNNDNDKDKYTEAVYRAW